MKKILYVCMFVCLLFLTGCGKDTAARLSGNMKKATTRVEKPVRVIPIGVIAPLTGPGSSYGQDVVEVVERFGAIFNATYSDVQLQWIVENGGCNGKDAASAAQKLITVDKVAVIIGGVCSSETLAAGKIAQQAGVLMIAPGSASSLVSDIGDRVVRTNNNTVAAKALADAVGETYAAVTIVAEQKDYPQDITDRFEEYIDMNVHRINFSPDERDFAVLAKQIAQSDHTDALFLFTQSEATSIPLVKALEAEGVLPIFKNHVYGANTLLIPAFLETFGALVDGFQEVNVSMFADPIVLSSEYAESIEDYTPLGDGFTLLQAADAMRMIILAVESGARLPEHFKQFVYYFDASNPYVGYTGKYWFDEKGDAVGIQFGMYEARNGITYPRS